MFGRLNAQIQRQLAGMEGARDEFERQMALLRSQMDAALEEFERAVRLGGGEIDAARDFRGRFGRWPGPVRRRRRRPGDDLHGGEPAPVEPRPKPKPLVDGAEAPID